MSFFWGVKKLDNSDIDIWDPTDLGKLTFDSEFDISEPKSQEHMRDLCDDLLSEARADIVKDYRVTCWIKNFESWLNANQRKPQFPVAKADF
mmetsp:Transcript_20255/g.17938  ORF Transcript_20255/g.17938 Transcript_20255/m.17938 type:complete len:92 (-) Transcript_20255:405-680(-)